MIMGAAAVLGSILVSSQCPGGNSNCQRVESAVRTAGTIGGIAGIMSGLEEERRREDSHGGDHANLRPRSRSEVAPQVVEVEGRTLKLTGTAEDQYREWREMLKQMYLEETGGVAPTSIAAGSPADDNTALSLLCRA